MVVCGSGVAQELEKLARLADDPGGSHRAPVGSPGPRFRGAEAEGPRGREASQVGKVESTRGGVVCSGARKTRQARSRAAG